MKRLPVFLLGILVSALAVLFTSLTPRSASAIIIIDGFDFFETTVGTSVDLTGLGLGVVPLQGNPIGGSFGNTDTIVSRQDGIDPFTPPSGTGTIPIELVALSLVSVNPVDLTPLGGPFVGTFSDLHVTINKSTEDIGAAGGNDDGVCDGGETCVTVPGIAQPDALSPSIGQMKINHTTTAGGTLESCFGETTDPGNCATLGVVGGGVFADSIFTVVGGDPNFPLDILINLPADRITLSGTGVWQHASPAGYPVVAAYQNGDLFVTSITHTGPHAVVTSIGGIAEVLVGGSHSPAGPVDGSGSSVGLYAALAGAVAAGAIAITAGGWYARRRFR